MKRKPFFLGLLAFALVNPVFAQDNSETSANGETTFLKTPLEELNSSYLETRPLISPDGNTLYFSRRSAAGSKRKKRDQDIYVARKDPASGSWGAVEPLASHLNNKRWNAVASVNPNGTELVLFNAYKRRARLPLVRTKKQEGSWSAPEIIQIQGYRNFNTYADFFIDYQQEVLLMAIEAKKNRGEQDLYVSFPDGKNGWGKPVYMGPVINSRKSDFAPFMGADGRTLFFSSFGHGSQGGSDIFMSVRLDDSWTKWSVPVNLGPAINTPNDENYSSLDKDFQHLYYSTQKSGREDWGQLLKVKLPDDFTAINGPVLAKLKEKEIQKIMDSGNYTIHPDGRKTNTEGVAFAGWPQAKEEPAAVVAQAVALEAEVPDAREEVREEMEEETEELPARLKGFRPAAEVKNISAAAVRLRDYLQEELPEAGLAIRPNGDAVEFKLVQNILFDFNSTQPQEKYARQLNKLVKVLQETPELKVQLIGHADSIGSREVNEQIAGLRVSEVRRYLEEREVSSSRIEAIGAGNTEPLCVQPIRGRTKQEQEGRSHSRFYGRIKLSKGGGRQSVSLKRERACKGQTTAERRADSKQNT